MKTVLFVILVYPFAAVAVPAGFIFQAFLGGFDLGRELVGKLADAAGKEGRK